MTQGDKPNANKYGELKTNIGVGTSHSQHTNPNQPPDCPRDDNADDDACSGRYLRQYLEATVNVAAVAKHHGIEAFVNMSQLTVSQMSVTETTNSPQHKLHWLAEQALNWSGLPVVHVRPTMFMDGFFLKFSSNNINNFNEIRAPFGSGKTSPIAAQDVALALAIVLQDPHRYIGTVIELTGPQSEDMNFYAAEFSEILGRNIRYIDVLGALWLESMSDSGLSKHVLDHLSTMGELHRDGRYDRMTDQFKRLTGKQPMSIRDFIRQHAPTFAVQSFNPENPLIA